MKLNYFTLLVPLILPALSMAAHWKSPHRKSWQEAQQECAEYLQLPDESVDRYEKLGYPDEPCVHKLVHCVMLTVNAWNDVTGVKDYVFKNFFHPAPSDSCYVNRTNECLCETVSQLPNHLQLLRAYRSFLCYYRNYGNIVQERQQFVPFTDKALSENLVRSFDIFDLPRSTLEKIASGNFSQVEEMAELLYVSSIRLGFYDPQSGGNRDRLFATFGVPETMSEKTSCCEDSVRRQRCEEPARVFETYKQCHSYFSNFEAFRKVAKKLLERRSGVLAVPCNSCDGTCRYCSNLSGSY